MNRIQPLTGRDQPEPTNGPAAGICARCVHGTITVLRCPGTEAWSPGHLTSIGACHNPLTALKQLTAAVERCDEFAPRRDA